MKVYAIEVTIGQLPEWYNEGEHDPGLEHFIEDRLHNVYPDLEEVKVYYRYSGGSEIAYYDIDGTLIRKQDFETIHAFEYTKSLNGDAV